MSEQVFNAYSRYYDMLYQDKDYSGEVNYIQALLGRHDLMSGDLLEFGSGTGKHGYLLTQKGYLVHGIERSAEMVAQARLLSGFTCEQGDICTVRLGRKFDAILSLFHVISYQTSNANVNAVFARAAEHLSVGGLFIFDFWYTPAVYSQQPVVRVKRMTDSEIEITRIAEPRIYPNENRVDVHYNIFAKDLKTNKVEVMNEIHPMRHFSLPEIDLLAEMHRFKRIETSEFLTGEPASESTWGVCVTLQRI